MSKYSAVALPYSVNLDIENGIFRVQDALGRVVIFVGSVRNIDGKVLPEEKWIEDEERAQIAVAIVVAMNATAGGDTT